VFELSRCLDWPNTRLRWGAQPRRLGRCTQEHTHPSFAGICCYDALVPTDLRRDVDESGPRVRHVRAVSDGPSSVPFAK
jgi:hypothetical protein